MSTAHKAGDRVPSDVLCARLRVLSKAVTQGRAAINREFYMRIPAELDNDADLVLVGAAQRIEALERQVKEKCGLIGDMDWHLGAVTTAARHAVDATEKARKIYGGTISFEATTKLDKLAKTLDKYSDQPEVDKKSPQRIRTPGAKP